MRMHPTPACPLCERNLLALASGGAAAVLAGMFINAPSSSDRVTGWVLLLAALVHGCVPLLAGFVVRPSRLRTGLAVGSLVLSVLVLGAALVGMEAAARP
jgi:hypothetical protein